MEPEYNTINDENQYEFILWCNELKPPTIDAEKFNMILQINIDNWIFENNITWQYAYGNTIDTLKAQKEIENTMQEQKEQDKKEKEEEEKEEQKPNDKVKRRELFAKMAEQRQKK
jgi:hypothetical protein